MKRLRTLGVHDGPFHADEVTAAALLIFFDLVDENKIIRSRSIEVLKECEYVCDVGGIYNPNEKLFDHHQSSYVGDLSSAGMILLYLKNLEVVSKDEFIFLNSFFIKGVDDHDNGKINCNFGHLSFSQIIATYNPNLSSDYKEEFEKAFKEALKLTLTVLKNALNNYKYCLKGKGIVGDVMKKYDSCLIFNENMPWLDNFFALGGEDHKALFVIMPAGEHWKLRGVPPTLSERMKVRLPLIHSWGGLLDEDLVKASGIDGAIFCHKGLFTSVWKTKEDAIKALEAVMEYHKLQANL